MDTLKLDYEAIGTVVALVTLIIALWKIQRSNATEFQKMQDRSETHSMEIENLKLADEKMLTKSDERVRVINGQIEALRSLHLNDVEKMTAKIERTFERSTAVEEAHHKEVMAKIEIITEKLTTVCVSFEAHRNEK
jgi:hypothetical protein